MSGARSVRSGRPPTGAIAAAVVLIVFVSGYMLLGYLSLDPASRNVPLLAGSVTLLLLGVELLRQFVRDGRPPRTVSGAHARDDRVAWSAEVRVLSSVVAVIAGVYLAGFLAAIPLYLIGAIVVIGGRSLRSAIAIALATTIAIYIIFELLLSYRLFPGVLFS